MRWPGHLLHVMVASVPDAETGLPPALAEQLAAAVISTSVHCRGCGYDLQGLPAAGRCPECGLEMGATVWSLIDPDATRLPRLHDPRAVGAGLVGLVLTWVLAVGLVAARPGLLALVPGARSGVPIGPLVVPRDLPLLAVVVALSGVFFILKLKPGRRDEASVSVWADVWLLLAGVVAWSMLLLVLWLERGAGPWSTTVGWLLIGASVAAIVALLGIGGVLRTIGLRSRAYRSSHTARQSVQPMIAAVAIVGLGHGARLFEDAMSGPPWLAVLGAMAVAVGMLMAFIGLVYMLLNALWINRALCRPPPMLEQLILPTLPDDTSVPLEDE